MANAIFRLRDRFADNKKPRADALAGRKVNEANRSEVSAEQQRVPGGGIFSGLVNCHHSE
jgi:hypothetical protein